MTDKQKATNPDATASTDYTIMSHPNLDNALLTPSELLEKFPYAKEIGWDEKKIKFLYDQHMIDGNYNETTAELKVLGKSFSEVLSFHKTQQKKV